MIHWLSVIGGEDIGKRFRLIEGQGTIGRAPSNQVQLIDGEISRIHCRYSLAAGKLELSDLESVNGTFVNDQTIATQQIYSGDQIKIGSVVMRYEQIERERTGDFAIKDKTCDESTDLSFGDGETDSPQHIQVRSDLNFMYHASLATSGNSDREQMLKRVVDLIFDWIAADRCCILLHQDRDSGGSQENGTDSGTALAMKASRARNESGQQSTEQKPLEISQSILNYVQKHLVGILTTNATQDDRISSKDSILAIGIREAICVPIRGREEMLGVIYVDSLEPAAKGNGSFNEDHLKLMIAIANQVAFAIENESYFRKILDQERLATVGRTTATLSHHIKNVMQGVNGGGHLINEGLKDANPQMVQAGWDIVSRNQDEVSKLISDMLTLGEPYHPRPIDADPIAVIEKVVQQTAPRLKRRNIACKWEPTDHPRRTFTFDPQGLHRAVLNLIRVCASCCESAEDGVCVTVQVLPPKEQSLTIMVSADGPQIDIQTVEETLTAPTNSAKQTLRAIELAVCRKLVGGHGGEVSLEHPGGKGNRFTIHLPLSAIDLNEIEELR